MFNLPNRITGDISQTFSDGYVEIYKTRNTAQRGYKADVQIIPGSQVKYRFAEQRVGINRYYSAKQANVQIDRVVRIPYAGERAVATDEIAVVNGDESLKYRIEQVQIVNDTNPKSIDLSLSLIRWGY